MSRFKRFTHSLLSGYVLLGANILYTFASVPLALHYLSKKEIGLWGVVTQIAGYLAEFARVCRRGRWVAFQLPSRNLKKISVAAIRKRLVELLPFGLDRAYRKWRHGCPVLFDMHFVPVQEVIKSANQAGLIEIHREPDRSAGESVESFIYIFKRQ